MEHLNSQFLPFHAQSFVLTLLLKSDLPIDCAFSPKDVDEFVVASPLYTRILEVKFATWDSSWLRYCVFKNHQQCRNTRRRQHAFRGYLVP